MSTSNTQVEDILRSLSVADAPKRAALLTSLYNIADQEGAASCTTADSRREFRDRWYGPANGILWRAWDEIGRQNQGSRSWNIPRLREICLLPIVSATTRAALKGSTPEVVQETFAEFRELFQAELAASNDRQRIDFLNQVWLGSNGALSKISSGWLKSAPPEPKREIGQALNELKTYIQSELKAWLPAIESGAEETALGHLDLSLPGVTRPIGTRHLISQTYEELYRIFNSIGFSVVEGAEIETPYYNFEALNIPEHHPARDNMDTFYLGNVPGHLLRTHTSPMQVRTMEKQKPPVRIVVPGKVYRRDNPDATHSFMFHQLEGLAVDTDITFCDFKGTIEYFAQQFFGPQTRVRLRPSYFPFTEPSAEFDASCHVCGGSGCRTCKYSGWIELFGAGMVDPAVYGFVDYDAKRLSGFAFGLGVDRLAMLKYGIDDLQQFFRNDTRFLRQFP